MVPKIWHYYYKRH